MFELVRLEDGIRCPRFTCGDSDLDEFYHSDSVLSAGHLLSVTYEIHDKAKKATLAFFCVSNDSITSEYATRSGYNRLLSIVPREKRYSSMPAVKIGRLGVHVSHNNNGLGSDILEFIKAWFTEKNKTGCRFIIVDAYNLERVINFYERNGFRFLTGNDEGSDTRIMYFDLMTYGYDELSTTSE